MISPDGVVDLYQSRRRRYQVRMTHMAELVAAVQGEMDIPLPEISRNEKPMTANLIASGLDQNAMRVVSTMPNVMIPPRRAGFDNAEGDAETKRNAIYAWWRLNKLQLIQRKRARWLLGLASAPVNIAYDPRFSYPVWQPRDPRTAYPPPGEDHCPPDCIFAYRKTLGWLRSIYPESVRGLDIGGKPAEVSPDAEFTILEYVDHEVIYTIVLGAGARDQADTSWRLSPTSPLPKRAGAPFVVLDNPENRAGICTAVVPTRICIDEPVGQFDGLIGLYYWQSRLMALGGIAAERDVFPDEWGVARPNEQINVLTEADGLRGIRGEITGGQIATTHAPPGQQTLLMIDRIERSMRLDGGIPAELGGESAQNIRTARRGAQLLASSVDFTVQEAQEIFEASLEEENRRAIAIDKAYFKGSRAFYYSWQGEKGRGSYVSPDLWDSDENLVNYSFPGADINQLVVGAGQRVGMETMSHHRFMELDPLIDDPELEKRRVLGETLERGLMQAIQQAIASGQMAPVDASRINQLVIEKGKTLFEAVGISNKEAQTRQATSGPPGTPEAPAPPGSPEAQPGLTPNELAAAGQSVKGPEPSQDNVRQLLRTLGAGGMRQAAG